jgi:hypothetical protein
MTSHSWQVDLQGTEFLTILGLLAKQPFPKKRRLFSGASNASLSFKVDIFIVALDACCDECLRFLNTDRLLQQLLLRPIARNRKHRRSQLLFRGLPRMRHLVFRSNDVQSLEGIVGPGCARLDVETTPPDTFVETGDGKSVHVCDKYFTNLMMEDLRVFELRLLLKAEHLVALAVEGVHESVCALPPLGCCCFSVPQGPSSNDLAD